MLALREAGMLERGELIDAGADKNRAREQPARRRHAGVEQRDARKRNLHKRAMTAKPSQTSV